LLGVFFNLVLFVQAQSSDSIIGQIQAIHNSITNAPCHVRNTPVISNRAMNIFLADKTGYISESTDLSFYTNYLTLNTAEGKLTVNHNFQKATGTDDPIRKLPCVGIWASMAGRYAATVLDKSNETTMGITLGYKWLGKVKTRGANCSPSDDTRTAMNALRTALTYTIANEVKKRSADFEASLNKLDTSAVPGQNIDAAKATMRHFFYEQLQIEYAAAFASWQAEALTETKNFTLVTTSWTSITACIPLLLPQYTVGASLTSSLEEKHPFTFSLQLSHTWLWESAKAGRLFIKLSGEAILNNAKWSYTLQSLTQSQYKDLGGSDTNYLTSMPNKQLFIGKYQSFVTPAIKGQLIYFPQASNIGVYFLVEQNIGQFHTLNSQVGIPIVLIDKKRLPTATFNFSVLFIDLMHSLHSPQKANTTRICLSAGIPFSRLMF
jgi:hypothetical protein